jgi:hypothetical protein
MSDNQVMRIRAVVVLAAAIAVLVTAIAALGAAKPTLRVADEAPLTLQGSGFRSQETVRITVRMNEQKWYRSARAALNGKFVVTFSGLRLNYCAYPVSVSARGSKSGFVKIPIPMRECAQP